MRTRITALGAVILALGMGPGRIAAAADTAPRIQDISVPVAGTMQILFHSKTAGPFRLQTRTSLNSDAPWVDLSAAVITELQTGVYVALAPKGIHDVAYFRIVSENETIVDLKGWTIRVEVSAPANGVYFVAGESPVVTVRILDNFAQGITRDELSTLSLYLYGPQDPRLTVTASKLLNASTNRAARPHHYIDLKTNPDVQVINNVLTYPLRPITGEAPGTYRLSVRASLASDAIQQVMKFADLQIGTATIEMPVVTRSQCASCHEGTVSGKMYLHHIDPSSTSIGSWSLDYEPVTSCLSCHNNDGYAAVRDTNGAYIADSIVRRVHGVHMGEGLKRDFNTNAITGDFRNYTHLEFPANILNCIACHADDRWKTTPTRAACGSCHDNTWFGLLADKPAGMQSHTGGPRSTDASCSTCHPTDGIGDFEIGVATAHELTPPTFKNIVNLSMTPPANGRYYVAGEAPQVTVQVIDKVTGQVVNPTNIIEPLIRTNVQPNEWSRGNLYVSGPRADTRPVLTTAALVPNVNGFYANNDFRVRRNPANEDPRVARTSDSIVYQLDTITNLKPGTYTVFAEVLPNAGLGGSAYMNFQVGTTNNEPMVAANCVDCHRDTRMHETSFAVTFTPDICKSCHDNLHQMTGRVGWTNSNNGFGAAPLSRRVHGVHFGKYLSKPEEIHRPDDYSEVIFPQDARNCTKCHSQSDTWTEKPSRVACLACHDSDTAIAHGTMMTLDFTPQEPFSGDEVETCVVCHGKTSEFAPKAVHAISNPFVPPYPRE